ncbi:hypothetical protein IFO69_09275 [Echinicola sp. CAU 1574]|uniref:Uncharacterized protein n=1 Tax=Echinicola arenosa TaxID=2774144 RepID=A0ABR9AK63_9BACT|nr:hypothetical protein [Echinicola arenosa]MBD8488934.1 hypothetical protein [Echinicola arenosa]
MRNFIYLLLLGFLSSCEFIGEKKQLNIPVEIKYALNDDVKGARIFLDIEQEKEFDYVEWYLNDRTIYYGKPENGLAAINYVPLLSTDSLKVRFVGTAEGNNKYMAELEIPVLEPASTLEFMGINIEDSEISLESGTYELYVSRYPNSQ